LTKKNRNELIKLYNHAVNMSRLSGDYIKQNINANLDIDFKGRADMVTQVDKKSEEIIRNKINEKYPDHQILAEESGNKNTDSKFKWIIDPLDGTTNFVHGYNFVSVSIALEYEGEIVLGIVNCPSEGELFTAIKNEGAYLNGKRIEVSEVASLENSLLATGFPYDLNDVFYKNMKLFQKFYESSQGVRRGGSAAMDLCYVACGRFDGFWEYDLNPWDIAAGSLIVREAGGKLSNNSGEKYSIYADPVIASNKHLSNSIEQVISDIS